MNFVTLCGVFILMLSIEGSLGFVTQCCEEYCYGTDSDREQARHYATKSAYQIIKSGDSSRYYSIPNCEPTKFWMLSRHGTRLPSAKDMQKLRGLIDLRDQIIDNYEKRRSKPDTGALCDADYHGIKNWRWDSNLTGNFDNFLTSQGWEDLVLLAKHYQRILPNVLPNIYTSDKYLFRHTGIQRTEESFRAFVEGLFGVNAYQHVTLPPDNNNTLLRPYDYCPAWETQSDVIDEPSSEMSKFIASEIYQDMLNQVSQRLGFKFQLTDDQVEQIWDMCRYEQAWYLQKLSPWCAAFTKTHVEILEYKEDLKYYFKNGYGSPLNSKVACALVADMMKNLESDAQPQAVAIEGSLGFVTQCCEEYCYGTDSDREQARHYATKSAYQIIKSGDSSRYYSIPNCEPTKFWMLSRHGTRLPSAKDMQKLRGLIDVEQIWDMCRYEQAWYLQKLSPWCAAFTKTHVEILEYKEDLKYYFKNGYGSPLNSKVACALVADMMKNLESDAQPQAVAYFAHDSAIQLLMTALGANKDRDSLRADNFLQNNRRTWRTSDIAPFGANLVAIKYNCPESNEPKKVMFFLNEKPVSLDWCRVGLCDWKDVRQMYNFYTTTDCSRTFCGGSTGNAIKVSLLALIVLPRFWLLSRHGTRLTPAKDTKILREKLPEIQKEILENYARDPKNSELCAEDLHLLEAWKWDTNVTEDQSEYLSQQGWEDLRGIAKYFQQQFPQRFPRKYSEEKFFFRHTNKQRTEASFQAFAEGLFGSYANVKTAPIPDKDTLLRPYDFSEEWQEQKKEIYQEGSEYMKFRKTNSV
uniref:Multiple inositol polyphosphate phosphatase 1 n=2 Tax=Lutzomyia longipalpis TaxID=7200 RepID=A0A1B0CIG3_LUTLO